MRSNTPLTESACNQTPKALIVFGFPLTRTHSHVYARTHRKVNKTRDVQTSDKPNMQRWLTFTFCCPVRTTQLHLSQHRKWNPSTSLPMQRWNTYASHFFLCAALMPSPLLLYSTLTFCSQRLTYLSQQRSETPYGFVCAASNWHIHVYITLFYVWLL